MVDLVFRCDGNEGTGLGHVTRCADLAVALRRGRPGTEVMFQGNYLPAAQRILDHHGLPFIPVDASWPPTRFVEGSPSVPVFIDSYRLTSAALAELGRTGRPVGVFDDFGLVLGEGAALVVNFRVGAEEFARYRSRRTGLGPSYFPTRVALEEARDARQGKDAPADIQRILLFIGGTDHFCAGVELVELVAQRFPSSEILWIALNAPTRPLPENVRHLPFQDELGPLLKRVDLVIAGGGRLKYEAAYALVPSASAAQTPEQGLDTAELARAGVCVDLGPASPLDVPRIQGALEQLADRALRVRMLREQAHVFPRDSAQNLSQLVAESLGLI